MHINWTQTHTHSYTQSHCEHAPCILLMPGAWLDQDLSSMVASTFRKRKWLEPFSSIWECGIYFEMKIVSLTSCSLSHTHLYVQLGAHPHIQCAAWKLNSGSISRTNRRSLSVPWHPRDTLVSLWHIHFPEALPHPRSLPLSHASSFLKADKRSLIKTEPCPTPLEWGVQATYWGGNQMASRDAVCLLSHAGSPRMPSHFSRSGTFWGGGLARL